MSPIAGDMLVNEIAPRIRSLTNTVPKVGAEDSEELIQDALAMAASILASVENRGKSSITAGNIAFYAIRLAKAGRRSTGSSKTDVLSPGTQMNGRSRVCSLEEPIGWEEGADEALTLGELLESEAEDPSVTGARNLDWHALVALLDEKARAILKCLAEGRPLLEVAMTYRISRSGVQTLKQKLERVVDEFMGPDVLAQVQRLPRWKDNIRASRERVACRVERQMA